jgi:hypothetical protein
LTTFVPNFIHAAEQAIYRRARHRGIETEFTANTGAGGVLALSGLTAYRDFKWIRTSALGGGFIRPTTIEALYTTYPDRTVAESFPREYARDGANIVFGPCAAVGVALDGVYYALLPALGASNTTNWFITNAPEVLLYGALLQAAPFIKSDERLPIWADLFNDLFGAVQEEGLAEQRTRSSRSVKIL